MTNRNVVRIQEESEKDKKPILEYNDKTYRSYVSQGFGAPDLLDYQERNFISEADVEAGGPITRTVTKIVRVKAPDYSSPRRERKEYLLYYENWYGKDWQGRSIPPVTDHVEGLYFEQDSEPLIERNKKVGIKRTGQHPVYYIPFSKKAVDEIIENSLGTDQETIIFTFVNGALSYEFPYQKFVNSSFDELNQFLIRPGGPSLVLANEIANKTTITSPTHKQNK